jgi:predicted methyltransferase
MKIWTPEEVKAVGGIFEDTTTLIQGDCLEVMSYLPDHSFDAVICDPPYG